MCGCHNTRTKGPRSPQGRPHARFNGTWRAEAGDPPEHAEDKPPPAARREPRPPHLWGGGAEGAGGAGGDSPPGGRCRDAPQGPMKLIPPGIVVGVLLGRIVSQLCCSFLPARRLAYVPSLLMTAAGADL